MTFPSIKRKIEELRPFERNSRIHSEHQVNQIAASIEEWGFTNPVIIDETGGIIAGHGRVLAAKQLGMTEVPCVQVSGWTDEQKRAYVIADNKLALNAEWDESLLRVELGELKDLDFDVGLIGFDADEMYSILQSEEFYFDEGDSYEEDEEGDPTKTTEGYVEFSLVMKEENKKLLQSIIRDVKARMGVESSELALMEVVRSYADKNP